MVCSLYPILRENPVAKLVSDPWFCAAVTNQVGLCAFHSPVFCGTRSAGSARTLCGAWRGGEGRASGWAKGVCPYLEGSTLLDRLVFTFSLG